MNQDWDEQRLARLCSEGNREAEEELYTRYAARVFTLCRRYSDNPDEAKDLMQEALLKALDRISTFKYTGNGSLYGWISRIAINLALNQIKRRRWRTVSLDFGGHDNLPEPTEEEMVSIPQEKLLEWIAELPDVRKAVFNLYCLDGYSHKEIAQMLGISEKGSAGMLAKARRQLKEKISRYWKNA
ncbi:MAG: sigma-70 family RNA polymerase sigma factor [Bacteroidales bacterium]|nr:sigma-70 family RNA polymerase sigma factor [Bacteroidales bacterium]